jgi:L-ascorbate metabolism protein UlaG (beta-lactamase superfamily)
MVDWLPKLATSTEGATMEITWYGHSCFRITERGKSSVVTDPYDSAIGYTPLSLKADIVTISHNKPGHAYIDAVREWQFAISRPGEYEIGGVFITGVAMINRKVKDPAYNIVYTFDYGNLMVAHLGDLAHVPSQSDMDALGKVDVALVPVGGGGALSSAQAAEVIGMLEPALVVPMHFQTQHSLLDLAPVDKFLTEMGVAHIEPQDTLKVTLGALPDQTQVVLLNYRT